MTLGEIYRCDQFYCDQNTGQFLAKYLIILALPEGGDVVARLITSQHGDVRPRTPPCFHGDPYPGFFLGALPAPFTKDSWLDLRPLGDIDRDDFQRDIGRNRVVLVGQVARDTFLAALDCAARADDTTLQQSRFMMQALASLR